jgi:hypothetical protein
LGCSNPPSNSAGPPSDLVTLVRLTVLSQHMHRVARYTTAIRCQLVIIRTRYLRNNSVNTAQCKIRFGVTARRVSVPPARGAVACDTQRASNRTPCRGEQPLATAGQTLPARQDRSAGTVPPAYQTQDAQFNVVLCTDVFRVSGASSNRCFRLSCYALFTERGELPETNETDGVLKPRNFSCVFLVSCKRGFGLLLKT